MLARIGQAHACEALGLEPVDADGPPTQSRFRPAAIRMTVASRTEVGPTLLMGKAKAKPGLTVPKKPHHRTEPCTYPERSQQGLPRRSHRRLRRAPCTTSAFRADALVASPSWKSMARTVLLSKRVLKSPFGSVSLAPFGKVSLTAFLRTSPMQTMPSCDQTATPSGREGFFHFTSSVTPGSAPLIRARSWPSF